MLMVKNYVIKSKMIVYTICKDCKKLVECSTEIKEQGGVIYKIFVCPNCGYTKKTSINYIHYGNDAIKK